MTRTASAIRRVRRWLPVLGFGAFAGLSLFVVELDYRRGVSALEETVVAVDNLTRARLAVADAALAWESTESGNPTSAPGVQLVRLGEALGALEDLLSGRSALVSFRGENVLESPALRALVETYRGRVAAMRTELGPETSAGDPVAQRLRLRRLAEAAADLERAVYRHIRDRLVVKRRQHTMLLGAWGGFLIVSLAGLVGLRAAGHQARLARLRAERARGAADRRYLALERVAAVGILRVDGSGIVNEVTPWWGRTMGMREGDCVGKPWWTVVVENERERSEAFWRERAALGAAFAQDARLTNGERAQRFLAGRWQPATKGPKGPDGWVGAFVDVTEQRLLETQVHQAQKLEAVGRLTGGLAHDFNNLLSVILTNSHLLLMDAGAFPEEDREMLADIDRAGKSGRDLVQRLMAFSRRGDLDLVRLDLSVAVREATTLARRLLPAGYEMEVSAPEPGPAVHADARAIEQIILNLVSNARDAMTDGGRIRITVDAVVADSEFRGERPWVEPGRYGRVAVSDDGVGMDEATMDQIFEPLFTTKVEGKGTGLGLSTVHGLMRQHAGHVRVYSEPGEGTTFRLYFPESASLAGAVSGARRPKAPDAAPGGGEGISILLVDDDVALRRTLKRMLLRLGYGVLEAGNGEEALRVLDGSSPEVDLILSDLSMAGMDGVELFRRLRERGDVRPFVLTSGRSEQDIGGRVDLPAGTLFLPKPWGLAEFTQLVDRLGLKTE